MSDLISRHVVIKGIKLSCLGKSDVIQAESAILRYIEKIPSAERKGKWIPHPNREYREWDVCTACGTGCKRREYGLNPNGSEWVTEFSYRYCPNCGADMRGEEECG